MPSITPDPASFDVVGGVDTHCDTHTAAVIDLIGRVLGTQQFPATTAGYSTLLAWMRGFGRLGRVGVEGTGAYGPGWPGDCVTRTSRTCSSAASRLTTFMGMTVACRLRTSRPG